MQDPARGRNRAYGAPGVTAELNDGATTEARVNHKRVARVMRAHGLAGIRLRKRVTTPDADQSVRRFPDLIGRDLRTGQPGLRYVDDIPPQREVPPLTCRSRTERTCSFRPASTWGRASSPGGSMADHMRSELVEDALADAARERGPLSGAIFHSDHGTVYTGKDFVAHCASLGVLQSMGAIG